MTKIQCDSCGDYVPSFDIINYGSSDNKFRQLCSCCRNSEVVAYSGEREH